MLLYRFLIDLMDQYNSSVDELIHYLRPKADGKTEILMAEEFNKVALDIIAKVKIVNQPDRNEHHQSYLQKKTFEWKRIC